MLQSYKALLFIPLAALLSISSAHAAKDCQAKKQRLEQQLSYAKQHNNTGRIQSLQTAIKNVERYCRDGKTKAELKHENRSS